MIESKVGMGYVELGVDGGREQQRGAGRLWEESQLLSSFSSSYYNLLPLLLLPLDIFPSVIALLAVIHARRVALSRSQAIPGLRYLSSLRC